MYPITLKGTVYGVNDSGQIRGSAVTQSILLQNIADNAGISTDNLALVYHVGGNVMGDTIDVIDRNDGRVLDSIYGFWFGTSFARRALYSADGANQRRLDYVYTDQAGVALGSAIIDKKQLKVRGGTMRLLVTGSMQWIVMPDSGGPAQICTARFSTGPKLVW